MLMLIDPQQRPDAALDFVVRAFGLSKAEARLLPLLFENKTPADIALALDIKISTVRSQLSAVFAKTGTTRQQELIRLLGTLPPIQRIDKPSMRRKL
jgi:DNA-binding CsgD family transcriptional regulator